MGASNKMGVVNMKVGCGQKFCGTLARAIHKTNYPSKISGSAPVKGELYSLFSAILTHTLPSLSPVLVPSIGYKTKVQFKFFDNTNLPSPR